MQNIVMLFGTVTEVAWYPTRPDTLVVTTEGTSMKYCYFQGTGMSTTIRCYLVALMGALMSSYCV